VHAVASEIQSSHVSQVVFIYYFQISLKQHLQAIKFVFKTKNTIISP
jgi:hypothetical protein